MRSVERIEFPSIRQLMTCVWRSNESRFIGLNLSPVCSMIDNESVVNAGAYMDFKKATDALFARVDHEDLAKHLGVSVASIRQARLRPGAIAHRAAPEKWRDAVIRIAEAQIMRYRKLIEDVRHESAGHNDPPLHPRPRPSA